MQVASSRCQKTHKLITHITSRNEWNLADILILGP
jgi:hypothetical protein